MCSVSSNDDCVLASLPSSFAPERRAGAPACVSSSPLPSSFPPFSASAFSQCRSLEFSRGCAGAPSLLSHLSSGSVAAASSAPSLQAAHAGGSRYPTRLLRDREWEVGETAQRDKEDGAAPTLLPRRPRGPGGGKAAAEMLRGYDLYM
ncbi:hypothetical protein NCLIV_024350 [Neospora caninum Liverpool]|nr:hypothetical protein NCLIV_024350 [Neospora caninum Liverpool]CBZ52647.1 hypothetical protein NCLIV_024350 [Neospora caninum Liverpool]|eukprot:XP_003882679.1 hypothetical protein NCLIV_024350 [Neospora caninum Liverpool]